MKTQNQQLNILDFNLLSDCVMVRPLETPSVDGLTRPASYDDKPEFGTVIKVGTGKLLENGTLVPLGIKEGDTIYFGKYSSIKIRSEGVDYLIIREYDVMANKGNVKARKTV